MTKVKVIAEIANAHNGDIDTLHLLIEAVASTEADAIKFQWFKYDHLATPDFSWYNAYIKLFIEEDKWIKAVEYAKSLGLEVWVDVFDEWGLSLASKLSYLLDGFKLPPTVLRSTSLARKLLNMRKPMLIGVGGWYDDEIDSVLSKLLVETNKEITLIYGFQGYPTKTEDINMERIRYLKQRFGLPVGFADHEDGANQLALYLPIYAFMMGATVLEKHITLERSQKGYDYYSSLEPTEFRAMVIELRKAEMAMGSNYVSDAQRVYLDCALRLVARRAISKDEFITTENTVLRRCPDADAVMPSLDDNVIYGVSVANIYENQPIRIENMRKPKIAIAVITRLKSTRLPQKALLPINGISLIERCLINCLAVGGVDDVILATSHLCQDDPLESITLNGRVKVLRGDPDNVAKRMIQAAEVTHADIILRVTGDCPAVSPEILEYLIAEHLRTGADFTTQSFSHSIGTGADVYTVAAIRRLLEQSVELTHTEYLSFYFKNNAHLFKSNIIELKREWQGNWRLTIDEIEDLEMFNQLYLALNIGEQPLYFEEIRPYLEEHPETANINAKVQLKWRDNEELLQELNRATVLPRDY